MLFESVKYIDKKKKLLTTRFFAVHKSYSLLSFYQIMCADIENMRQSVYNFLVVKLLCKVYKMASYRVIDSVGLRYKLRENRVSNM